MKKISTLIFILLLTVVNAYTQGLKYSNDYDFNLDEGYDVILYPNPVIDNFFVKSDYTIKTVVVLNVIVEKS